MDHRQAGFQQGTHRAEIPWAPRVGSDRLQPADRHALGDERTPSPPAEGRSPSSRAGPVVRAPRRELAPETRHDPAREADESRERELERRRGSPVKPTEKRVGALDLDGELGCNRRAELESLAAPDVRSVESEQNPEGLCDELHAQGRHPMDAARLRTIALVAKRHQLTISATTPPHEPPAGFARQARQRASVPRDDASRSDRGGRAW